MSRFFISVNDDIKIEGGKKVTRISVQVPGHGYYSSIRSVFEALTFSNAVVRMDHVHDGEYDEGDDNESGRVLYWKGIREVCLGDDMLLQLVTRIMAGDTMGNENEEAALEDVQRYYS